MKKINLVQLDQHRYGAYKMPRLQLYFRKQQVATNPIIKFFYRFIFQRLCYRYHVELHPNTKIGPGLYLGHIVGITFNPDVIIGKNVNIHKGVTLGQENRGSRRGSPIIGDNVWIGINSTIVGRVTIGDDVLIAPNTYVNCDVPSHSVVFGNPCIIKSKENATEAYINNRIE
ncbi:serine O-acetyltransferase [Streptococcus sp. E17BB]|uniref:serine O-acetyltransferase n=1 Tax=Streptococcus sp. E17BB TaxID=3278714 RepID=UPI00359EDB18